MKIHRGCDKNRIVSMGLPGKIKQHRQAGRRVLQSHPPDFGRPELRRGAVLGSACGAAAPRSGDGPGRQTAVPRQERIRRSEDGRRFLLEPAACIHAVRGSGNRENGLPAQVPGFMQGTICLPAQISWEQRPAVSRACDGACAHSRWETPSPLRGTVGRGSCAAAREKPGRGPAADYWPK